MGDDVSNRTLMILAVFVLVLSVFTTWVMLSHDSPVVSRQPFTATGDVAVTVINPGDYYRAYQEQQGFVFDPSPVRGQGKPARNRITGAAVRNFTLY